MFGGSIDLSVLPLFLPAVVLICIAPGPDMAYMISAGLAAGRKGAVKAAFGITVGVSVYGLVVAAGMGSILARNPQAFMMLKVMGAAYLAWLAWATFKGAQAGSGMPEPGDLSRGWFLNGFIVNITNPKVALFFLAFLPQFLGRASNPAMQLLFLGLVLQISGLAIDLLVGCGAGHFRERVSGRPGLVRWLRLASAATFGLLAALVMGEAVASWVA